jgi:hypothetical protein
MKFKSPLFSLGLIGLWYILVAYSSNPPTGATGGAGQATCNQGGCHTAAQVPYVGGVAITGVPNPVAPNTAYTVTLTAASNAVIGGFELMCLNSSNAQCGTLAAGTGSSVVTAGGKQYVRQDNPVTYAGGTASWTFTWTSPASVPNNNITFYYISLAANDNGGKTGDNSLTGSFATQLAAAPAPLTVSISQQQNVTCNGSATGGALATATGGSGSYTYAWSNGSMLQGLVGVTAGTYTVTATSGASTGTANVTITQPSAITGTAVVNGMITCNTPSVGVSASASGGAGGYTYTWSNGTTGATTTYNTVGVHTVTVTDNSLCQKVTTFTISGSTQAPTANAGIDKTVTCANPTALLTATGGGTYFWSNGMTSASIGVAPQNTTTYTVTVTGSNGCTASDNVVVFVNNTPPTAYAGPDITLNCTTPSTTLVATGAGNGSYVWSNGSNNASTTISPSSTTTYIVTVTNIDGCTATDAVLVTVDEQPPIAYAGQDQTVTCTTPSVTLTAIGGGSYVWSNASNNASTTVSPSTTTTYIVTVTYINGCTATDNVVVTVNKTPPVANAGPDQTVTCTVPSVTLTATGGTSYLWNNNITNSATFTPSATNTYTVTVTGANGCTATDAVVVTVNKTAPVANAGLDQTVNCTIPSVTLNATGGGTYAWGNGIGNTASITVSPSSTTTYTVTITGSNGCTATDAATVLVDITIPVANAGQGATITVMNPTATLTATGGVSYNWSNGAFGATITVSSPGTYTVTVTGANGCSATDNVTVAADNMPPLANAGPDKTVTCANPTATLTATGGTFYAWSSNAATTSSISVSPSVTTTYTVTVTGTNGATATDNVTVFVDKVAPTANAGSDVTTTCANPSTTLSATGGSTYIWSNGGTTASINVAPTTTTTYIVTATGTNGCTATDNVVVTPNAGGITANAGADATVTCGNPSTTLTGIGNGTLSWGNAGIGATITVSPTSTTTYTFSVTGANGCVVSDQVVVFVNNQAPVVAITTIAEKPCTSAATIVTATSPSPTPNLTYLWSGPNGFTSTAAQFTTSVIGTYTVTATNPTNGCLVGQTTTVKAIAPPIALTIASSSQGCNVTCLTPTVTGGTAPFTYSWGAASGAKFCTEIPGTYTVTVSDGVGCTTTASAQVTTSPALIVTTTNTTNATTGQSNGGATILVAGGTPTYTYSWTNANNQVVGTAATLTGVPAGVYICKVTDATGCIFAQTVLIKEMVATADLDLQRLVNIYPNPAQGECFINLTEATEGIVTFYNLQGQVLLNQTLDQALTRLDVQDMASGTYMVVVKLDKKMVMKKVVVE